MKSNHLPAIVERMDEEGDIYLDVAGVYVPLTVYGNPTDGRYALEEMLYGGLLGEHAPSGMKFEQVGYEDYEWQYYSWVEELEKECAWLEEVERFLASGGSICA